MSEKKTITVRVKKAGWEVEITCEEDEFQKAMEERPLIAHRALTHNGGSNPGGRRSGHKKTVRGLLLRTLGRVLLLGFPFSLGSPQR